LDFESSIYPEADYRISRSALLQFTAAAFASSGILSVNYGLCRLQHTMDFAAREKTCPYSKLLGLQRQFPILFSMPSRLWTNKLPADPGYHMRYQAKLGDVDFITGDYLAEVNIAENAQAHAAGHHPGWEQTCWDGIEQSIEIIAEKRIKVVVNGGAHNPQGLAEKVQQLVSELRVEIR